MDHFLAKIKSERKSSILKFTLQYITSLQHNYIYAFTKFIQIDKAVSLLEQINEIDCCYLIYPIT